MTTFHEHAGPLIEAVIGEFGDEYGKDTVRDLSTKVLGINTCGSGVHPSNKDDLTHHYRHSVECVTQRLEVLEDIEPDVAGSDLVDVIDHEKRTRILGDEHLGATLLGAFVKLWPDGRQTNLGEIGTL